MASAHISTSIPTGGLTVLQLQSGAVTVNSCEQFVVELVTVKFIFVPELIPEIVKVPSILSVTVPSVDIIISASDDMVIE